MDRWNHLLSFWIWFEDLLAVVHQVRIRKLTTWIIQNFTVNKKYTRKIYHLHVVCLLSSCTKKKCLIDPDDKVAFVHYKIEY